MRLLLFIVGAGIGAPLRYAIDKVARARSEFPIGILFVNVVGSFILGISHTNYFVMGFCGAFTTWSALALDLNRQNKRSAAMNVFVTFVLCIAAVVAGKALVS